MTEAAQPVTTAAGVFQAPIAGVAEHLPTATPLDRDLAEVAANTAQSENEKEKEKSDNKPAEVQQIDSIGKSERTVKEQ